MARRVARSGRASTEKQDRAWRAVRAFNRLVPQLTHYARALTRNLRVEVRATASESNTDGRVIWIRPPARLGDDIKHDKFNCNKRSQSTLRQMCPACDVHELVMAALYHEMAHIVFGTMVLPINRGISAIQGLINEWHPAGVCSHAKEMEVATLNMIASGTNNYLGRAAIFDPRLSMLINAFEDARVNTSMFDARPGTRSMFAVHLRDIFEMGADENEEDNPLNLWQNRSLDEQLLIGTFLAASEHYEELSLLSQEAQDILWSVEVESILRQIARADSVHDVVELTIETFRLFQKLGHILLPKCESSEDKEEDDAPGLGGDGLENERECLSSPGDTAGENEAPSGGGGPDQTPTADATPDGGDGSRASGEPGSTGCADVQEPEDTDGGESDDSDSADQSAAPVCDDSSDSMSDTSSDDEDTSPESDADESNVQEEDGEAEVDSSPSLSPEELTERLEQLARRMTMHHLIHKYVEDADTTEFASGESMLIPEPGEGGAKVAGGWGDAGDLDDEGNVTELLIAIAQALFFDAPSRSVDGVDEITFPHVRAGWVKNHMYPEQSDPATFLPPQTVVGKVITEAQLIFEENKRNRYLTRLKSGKVNTRALTRAPLGDERLFRKRNVPGKKDYMVVLGFDMSGSTAAQANGRSGSGSEMIIDRIKRAVFAQAEMLSALNIPFEIWGHSAGWDLNDKGNGGTTVWMFKVKSKDDAWGTDAKVRLASVTHCNGNLDGHTLEFYRKRVELSNATDKIICYYTDGAMPAMNPIEEKEILIREVDYCRKVGIHLLAVGIETDSPKKFGFETVEVNNDMDLVKVVQQLQRSITK